MKRYTLLSLLFIVAVTLTHAQQVTEFEDDFSDNKNGWLVSQSDDLDFHVSSGEYQLNKKRGEGTRCVWRSIPLIDSRDWSIEAKIKFVDGSDSYGFGILFNSIKADSCNAFVISGNGSARVYAHIGSTIDNHVGWRKTPAIRPMGEWNTLKIIHQFDVTAFFVNGSCIGSVTTSDCRHFGNKVGFVVENVVNISIDNLIVQSAEATNRTVNAVSDGGTAIERVNLGPKLNSNVEELAPISTADGKTLYFTRRFHPQNTGKSLLDDIWMSTKDANNEWTEAINVGAPLNNEGHNGVVSVAPDNNTLILQNTYLPDGTANGPGISISHRTTNGWEVPKTIHLDSGYNLNKYCEYCLSPDGKVLLAAIEQYDTKGSKDLYVLFRVSDTAFSRPKHILELSTIGSEIAPFIASDGKTMYFSTDGRAGYGGQDIFVTTRLDSTWLHWSEPKNLGNKINSRWFDSYFRLTAKGDSAYLITTSNTLGSGDVARIVVPPDARPNAVCLISGHVFDAKTKKPLGADVKYENLSTHSEAGIARSNPANGFYSIVLPVGEFYGFRAEAEGYYPVSEQLDTKNIKNYEELSRDLFLIPIELNATIRLNNLFFDVAKWDLRPESANELDRLVDFLRTHPDINIAIEGHTDNTGDDKSNLLLSQNRAGAVLKYLNEKGIQQMRMTAKGYGKTKPIDLNTTEEGRQKNRRVEYVITKK